MYVHWDTGHRDPMAARTQCNGTGIMGLYKIHVRVCMKLKEIGSLTVTRTKIRGQQQHREFDLYTNSSVLCTVHCILLVLYVGVWVNGVCYPEASLCPICGAGLQHHTLSSLGSSETHPRSVTGGSCYFPSLNL
jgi:hypothetical protein